MREKKRVLVCEPTAKVGRTRNADPDDLFSVSTSDGRILGWGPNRASAWRAADALVCASALTMPEQTLHSQPMTDTHDEPRGEPVHTGICCGGGPKDGQVFSGLGFWLRVDFWERWGKPVRFGSYKWSDKSSAWEWHGWDDENANG